jgi:energy-coupling factor transport system permease protein
MQPVNSPLLTRVNPVVKLFAVVLVTVLVSITVSPALPIVLIAAVFLGTLLFGGVPAKTLFKGMLPFLIASGSFVLFLLIMKGLAREGNDVTLLIFSYRKTALMNILALGLRILVISLATMSFVLTTNPNDLVLSLILQLHVPVVHGYAALAAYRFLPTLQDEARGIRLAQEIRGVEWEHGLKNRLSGPFRLMLPMFTLAARKGERVALAMDSRGLGAKSMRTFYKRTSLTRSDLLFAIAVTAFCAITILVLSRFGLFTFGSALDAGAI